MRTLWHSVSKVVLLIGLIAGLALTLPDTTEAASLNEIKKLTASDAQAGDVFGRSVAIDGNTSVVGACCEDTGGSSAGAAYVFERDEGGAGNWGETKKLLASDAQGGAIFVWGGAVRGRIPVVAPSVSRSADAASACAWRQPE